MPNRESRQFRQRILSKVVFAAISGATLFLCPAASSQPVPVPDGPSDAAVAASHGISLTDVQRLHGYRHLTNVDLASMSSTRVRGVLWRLDNPRPDEPLAAAQYRTLLETGGVAPPPNALSSALQELQALRQQASQLTVGPQPAARSFSPQTTLTGRETTTIAGIPVGSMTGAATDAPMAAAGPAAEPSPEAGRLLLRLEALPLPTDDYSPSPAAGPAGGLSPGRWRWLGPGNIGGRTRSIVVHPFSPNIMWAASVAGGIWKTTDGGQSWAPLADFLGSLNVSTLLIAGSSNPNLLFAGTGEGFYNIDAFRGAGIFRTMDGGATWQQLPTTAGQDFWFVNRLALSAGPSPKLLAATRSGLYVSTNYDQATPSAVTFTRVQQTAGQEILETTCHVSKPNDCIASGWGYSAFVTVDGGISWKPVQGLPSTMTGTIAGRVEFAYSRAGTDVVYASVDREGGEVYRSSDGGANFALISNPGHLGGQGWYANTIWAGDPQDGNIVVVGGLDVYRSSDAGQTFDKISAWQNAPNSAHADHHTIVAHSGYNGTSNRVVFFGNDGGIYRNDDLQSAAPNRGWVPLNNNYGVTQFYGGAGSPSTGRIVAGAQDNGTLVYRPPPGPGTGPNAFSTMFGGDGGFAAADAADPNFFYGEYVYLQIFRDINGGTPPANYIYGGSSPITDSGSKETALFIAPFILDPFDQATMIAGGRSIWRATNVKAATPAWQGIKGPESGARVMVSALEAVRSIERGTGRSDMLWVGYTNGEVFVSKDAHSSAPTWARVDGGGGQGLPARLVTRIRVRKDNPAILFVSFAGYAKQNLWKSENTGQTWTAVGQNLPSISVYDVAFHPSNPELMYAATELGVFASEDGGVHWWPTNQGPANVAVNELFWMGQKLVAVTHGRGLFWIDLSPQVVALSATQGTAPAFQPSAAAGPAASADQPAGGVRPAAIIPTDPANSQ